MAHKDLEISHFDCNLNFHCLFASRFLVVPFLNVAHLESPKLESPIPRVHVSNVMRYDNCDKISYDPPATIHKN